MLSALAFDDRAIRRPADTQLAKQSLGPLLTANDMGATAHAASKHPRGGLGLGAGSEGAGGVGGCGEGRSWWSIEFDQSISDWLGRCLYPHSRACACVIPGRGRAGGSRVDRANTKTGISGATCLRDEARWKAARPGDSASSQSAVSGAT